MMIEALDRGVTAYMPTLYHDVYGRVISLYDLGRRAEAMALFRMLLPNLVFHSAHPLLAYRVSKLVLHAEGVFATARVRVNRDVEPDGMEIARMRELAESARRLSETLDS
jgi:hypothetical protein